MSFLVLPGSVETQLG